MGLYRFITNGYVLFTTRLYEHIQKEENELVYDENNIIVKNINSRKVFKVIDV